MNKLQFKFDYLNGIVPITRADSFFESLKNIDEQFALDNWVSNAFAVRGIRNYDTRWHFLGKNHFIVSYNCTDTGYPFIAKTPDQCKYNPYIYITISSHGLSYFSKESLSRFLMYLYRLGFKCSRLDIACDIYNRDNVIVPLLLNSFHFTSSMRKDKGTSFISSKMSLEPKFSKDKNKYIRPVTYYNNYYASGDITENVVFGNHGSTLGMFRIYDKHFEQGHDLRDLSKLNDPLFALYKQIYPDNYWYRLEVEMHHTHANNLFNLFFVENLEIYDLFASALVSFFDVRVSKGRGYQVSQCDVSPVWSAFLNELSQSIHLVQLESRSVPVVQMPIEDLKELFIHYAPMICAFEDLSDLSPEFRDRVLVGERSRYDNNVKYQYLRQVLSQERKRRLNTIVV